ncbi:Membrane protein involved in the export of O-antigen and teichoic acid [Natronoarchaeum philippinense]|uniref:Membrane protein involved in the export of O-antigen and teichoic acid n=1 Tax=Natronoarchaeum philippinense TaxID=558529 RepID=A0A285P110_NATPI|nr:flippase [Natronoarchaeum philippinense]SNZ15409.1 Membrane protein involved in the export of O-antigen and teichoic acid [Natronoarchaeum philippinense]
MSSDSSSVNTSLREILRGGSIFVLAKVITNAAGFLLNWVLIQALGTALYGIYAYARLITATTMTITAAGMDKGVLKYVPANADDERRDQIVSVALGTVFVFSVLIAVCLYLFAPIINQLTLQNNLLPDVLQILAITVPFYTLTTLLGAVFRSMTIVEYDALLSKVFPRIARLLAAVVGLLLGYTLVETVVALAVASALVFAVAVTVFLAKTDIRARTGIERETAFSLYNFSFPLMFSRAGTFLYKRIDVFMVGIFLTSADVGIYNIAALLATAIVIPLSGINQLFPPIASELYTNGKIDRLESVYQIVTRWAFTIAAFGAALLVVHRTTVLSLFGDEVTAATALFSLLVLGHLVNATAGPSNYVLMMADHQYLTMINQWAFGLLNVALNYVLLTQFGLIGAAIGTMTSLSLLNVVRVIQVWYLEKIVPYSWQFAKPIAACIIATLLMVMVKPLFTGYSQLLFGGTVGGVTFLLLLYVFGIEEEDESFVREEIIN